MIQPYEAVEALRLLPHTKECRNNFARQLCNCPHEIVLNFIEQERDRVEEDETDDY